MKNRTLAIGGVGVALIAAVAIAGPIIYAKTQADAPAPLSVAESESTADTGAPAFEKSGTWKVAAGSKAGYRVGEVLNGQDVTVVGRTGEVTADVTIAADRVTAAKVTVETANVKTDSANRDNYFRSESLKVDRFPTATFTLDAPINLPEIGNKAVKVNGKGELTLAGRSEDVNVAFKIVRSNDGVAVSGAIPITFKDFGIPAPNLGFVKVEDSGTVEFLLNLEK